MIYYRNDLRKSGIDARKVKATLQRLLEAVDEEHSSISLSLVDDERIKELNRRHRAQDKATDVMSFPQRAYHRERSERRRRSDAKPRGGRSTPRLRRSARDDKRGRYAQERHGVEQLLGDIVISVETARRQAAEYDAPLERELERLLIHGLLHLLGHDHERAGERRRMVAEERRLAACIGMPWPYEA